LWADIDDNWFWTSFSSLLRPVGGFEYHLKWFPIAIPTSSNYNV
jgi:hypothetical protein